MELVIFKELEEKIRSMAQEHALLKKRNFELEELLKKKTSELEELSIAIKEFDEERIAIRTKVDSLLELLQDVKVQG
ncbi:cell division protein ZapB [Syntrophus aciditrophicus]|uniref:Hypothetical cytosolic protein n=1 Tax=Syntrophus aciditrophicus (strain SB) TaxID=56780 RepID=Q2LRA2_SYNAS|nr:cell division protein ZapB [Syntrophus aciditrophicus]ABC76608.1 hypothetical cytosolic protein [Syntrophus aciditrophicus SB]OPY17218.1 MAG: hypothetical protein A4E74_01410 [Syntrophus sp. PtaB.Bin075]